MLRRVSFSLATNVYIECSISNQSGNRIHARLTRGMQANNGIVVAGHSITPLDELITPLDSSSGIGDGVGKEMDQMEEQHQAPLLWHAEPPSKPTPAHKILTWRHFCWSVSSLCSRLHTRSWVISTRWPRRRCAACHMWCRLHVLAYPMDVELLRG